jgi:hypothetical protein
MSDEVGSSYLLIYFSLLHICFSGRDDCICWYCEPWWMFRRW